MVRENHCNWICIFFALLISISCKEYEPCENTQFDKEDLQYVLQLGKTLEENFTNLTIYPGNRVLRNITVSVDRETEREELIFTSFYKDLPNSLKFIYSPYWGDAGISAEYTGLSVYSREFLSYWHQKFSWMDQNGILAIEHNSWGFSVVKEEIDSTYLELSSTDSTYFDNDYERIAEMVLAQGCTPKYRYKFLYLTDTTHLDVFLRLIKSYETYKTLHQVNDRIYYSRTLNLSGFCGLDFKTPHCR